MSGAFNIPQNILDGKSPPFPAGTYVSKENEVKQVWSEDKKSLDFQITLKDNAPVEGSQIGKRPMVQRITVIYKEKGLVDVTTFDQDTPFPLQRGAGLLGTLAQAVGAATANPEGGATLDVENFLGGLASGLYAKNAVGFEVQHRAWKSKTQLNTDGTPKTGVAAEIVRFFPAA
jgi:hypothetical protein